MVKDEKKVAKGELYALAFSRIDMALREQFPLEAIALEESIISDRLRSILSKALPSVVKTNRSFEVSSLLNLIQAYVAPRSDSLWTDTVAWTQKRNQAIHGIVASRSGKDAKIPAANFVSHAMSVARKGLELARKISHWVDKENRVIRHKVCGGATS